MKSIIRNAIIYKATVPSADLMREHLDTQKFTECVGYMKQSAGFVPRDNGNMLTEFPGGIAVQVRIDQKIVPGAAVKAEVEKRIKSLGRKVGRKERAEIKEIVVDQFTERALVKTAIITMFHHTATGYLIVATSSKKYSDIAITQLIHAVGSVKTETIHVSDVKGGLTKRMNAWLGDDASEAFGDEFWPREEVALVGIGAQRLTVKLDGSLSNAKQALTEAFQHGFLVNSMRLQHNEGDCTFRLTHDFRFNGIEFPVPEGNPEDVAGDGFAVDAMLCVGTLASVVSDLCKLLEYKAPAEGGAA